MTNETVQTLYKLTFDNNIITVKHSLYSSFAVNHANELNKG